MIKTFPYSARLAEEIARVMEGNYYWFTRVRGSSQLVVIDARTKVQAEQILREHFPEGVWIEVVPERDWEYEHPWFSKSAVLRKKDYAEETR